MKISKPIIVLSCICFLSLQSSCDWFNRDDLCNAARKADMIFDLLALANPNIATGIAFVVNSIVQNVADSECTENTASSGNHVNGYVSVFRDNPNDPWEQVDFIDGNGNTTSMVDAATPSLNGGERQPINLNLEMSVPGKYMVIGASDSEDDVDERNENNNGAETNEGSLGGLWEENSTAESRARILRRAFLDNLIEGKDYVVIDVKPSPDYDPNILPEGELPKIMVHKVSVD